MNPAERTLNELEEFRKSLRPPGEAGKGVLMACHDQSCTGRRAEELRGIIGRPPPGMVLYKYGSRSVVGGYHLTDGGRVVLKYYYPRGIHKHLGYGIRGSRCMRSWNAARALEFVGIATPAALMIAEWQTCGGLWLERSTLVTEQADGVPLADWLDLHGSDSVRLERLAARLRDEFSRMARYRISHGDLKQSNIIIGNDDSPSFVDLDAVTFHAGQGDWEAGRARDMKIFNDNWNHRPQAAAAFAGIFS
jgi:tRNA A-37 threonylcarbamoyl transferase component Bud32